MSNNHSQPLPVHSAYQNSRSEALQNAVAVEEVFTPGDILGPYWLPNSPARDLLVDYEVGTIHALTGTVRKKDGSPCAGAVLDFWLANTKGVYSGFADQGTDGLDYCRGHVVADQNGRYSVRFRRPGRYKISDTEERTPHVHVKVKPQGGTLLTTQLYFPDEAAANEKDGWEPKNDPRLLMEKVSDTEFRFNFTCRTFH